MSSRLAVAGITAALCLVACGAKPPTTAPTATGQATSTTAAPSPSSTLAAEPSASPSASPDGALHIDDPAYLAGDPFTLSVGEAGADWTAPSVAPVMPNGQRAARVAFLPASCAAGNFRIYADAPPEDAWETSLRADFDEHHYTMGSWPGAQVPECATGHVWTYLQVAYHPFEPLGIIHLFALITTVIDAPAAVQVVPVFTSADATLPWLTSTASFAMEPVSGREKPRSPKAHEMFAEGFARATLPDGTTPTQWGFELTACGPVGPKPVIVTARVGGGAPVDVGRCSDGSILTGAMSLPLPADGTQVRVLMAGGTTKSQIRVSEFQWRGDRP